MTMQMDMAQPRGPGDSPLLIDVDEVARLLSLGVRTVWKLSAEDGAFPRPVKIGGATRWHRSAVEAWAQRTRQDADPAGSAGGAA